MADPKQSGSIRCVITTPETTTLDTHARSVVLPLDDGERGVAHGHAPFIGRLGAGEVRVIGEQAAGGEAVRRVFVEGGFVEVGHGIVSVITQRAVPAEALDAAAAKADLERIAASRATGDEAIATKLRELETARKLVRTASRR
ncbi:MAG: F0F1 ATP synthase subunit epsilon [Pirellulales bacterium]